MLDLVQEGVGDDQPGLDVDVVAVLWKRKVAALVEEQVHQVRMTNRVGRLALRR